MRWRLILSFVFIVVITITVLVVAVRRGTANEVRAFMFRGGMVGIQDLVAALEDYYRVNDSWEGLTRRLCSPDVDPVGGWQLGGPAHNGEYDGPTPALDQFPGVSRWIRPLQTRKATVTRRTGMALSHYIPDEQLSAIC
jgi:hypothetical protein